MSVNPDPYVDIWMYTRRVRKCYFWENFLSVKLIKMLPMMRMRAVQCETNVIKAKLLVELFWWYRTWFNKNDKSIIRLYFKLWLNWNPLVCAVLRDAKLYKLFRNWYYFARNVFLEKRNKYTLILNYNKIRFFSHQSTENIKTKLDLHKNKDLKLHVLEEDAFLSRILF